LPYIDEWMKDKCRVLSESEKERKENYSRRLVSARSSSDADLSKAEWADLDALQKKQDQELKCQVSILRQRRADAYARYFGAKPNDFANQNFSKWSEATKYLGRHFYEVMSEEKFNEEKLDEEWSSLKRDATATAPEILLLQGHGYPPKHGVVGTVHVIGTPNPSPEYVQRLVKSLEDAWGKPTGGSGTTERGWTTKEFSAVLKKETRAADGPLMDLEIDARE
jgi:hypothetical protein